MIRRQLLRGKYCPTRTKQLLLTAAAEEEETSTAARTPLKRLGLCGPRMGGGGSKRQSKLPFPTVSQSPAKRQRLGSPSRAAASLAALQRQPSSGTFSGWRDEDANTSRSRTKTKTFLEEDDEDDLNEGFYQPLAAWSWVGL